MSELLDVEVKNITKIYSEKTKALDGLSLEVQKGDYLAIMGPSGSGKSTLLNIIGCLDTPTEGTVKIDGVDTSTLNDDALTALRRDKIGFIFQSFNLIPYLTSLENIALPLYFKGVSQAERTEVAARFLRITGFDDSLFGHRPNELSGGEQQRVAIARALCNDPSILLADEPTGNLDSETGKSIMDAIKGFNRELEKTVILVTHDPNAASYARRKVFLKDGRLDHG